MQRTDETLLLEAIRGDDCSFSELARRWEKKIFGFVFRYNGNREDSQDVVQSTFIKAYKNLDKLQDTGSFSAWLYRIALNECRIGFRKSNRIRGREVSYESRNETSSVTGTAQVVELGVDTVTPEQIFSGREELNRLGDAFYRLPGEQREVILMREYQGLRFREISEVLDVPLSTVKSRLYLGLKTLRKFMEETQ
jgi:RNA polymerase sigma-70 factor, ECF subfamily